MKKYFKLLIALLFVSQLHAQEIKYLNIVLNDNSCVSYAVDNNAVTITFSDSCMRVNNVDFFIDNIVKYYVSDNNDAISGIGETYYTRKKIVGNYLYITAPEKGCIKIYDTNGKCILAEIIDGSYSVIDLSSVQSGTYIVRINKESFKFVKL